MSNLFRYLLTVVFLLSGLLFSPAWMPAKNAYAQSDPNTAGKIELPDDPRTSTPPRRKGIGSESGPDEDLDRKRQQRQNREKQFEKPVPTRSEKKNEQLVAESLKDRPMQLFFESSFLRPGIKTKGPRERYTLDSTNHFQLFVRGSKELPTGKAQLWWGFRLAPFAGSGVYKNIPGRFGFLYFGPMIGLGKIDTLRDTLGETSRGRENEQTDFSVRHGWLVTTGIAAQSRIGDASRDENTLEEDLNSKKIGIDSPGLWLEMRYLSVHYGAIGLNLFAGAQAGKEKQLSWVGIGVAGWY